MDKEMLIIAADIIRTAASHQTGFKRLIGKLLNKAVYSYALNVTLSNKIKP